MCKKAWGKLLPLFAMVLTLAFATSCEQMKMPQKCKQKSKMTNCCMNNCCCYQDCYMGCCASECYSGAKVKSNRRGSKSKMRSRCNNGTRFTCCNGCDYMYGDCCANCGCGYMYGCCVCCSDGACCCSQATPSCPTMYNNDCCSGWCCASNGCGKRKTKSRSNYSRNSYKQRSRGRKGNMCSTYRGTDCVSAGNCSS